MAIAISEGPEKVRADLAALSPDTKVGMTRTGYVVTYGGFDYCLHPQQNARMSDFVMSRDNLCERIPTPWNKFVSKVRAVLLGVKSSLYLRVCNYKAPQQVDPASERRNSLGSAPAFNRSPQLSNAGFIDYNFESPTSIDRAIDVAQAKLAAVRARKAAAQSVAPTAPTAPTEQQITEPAPLRARLAANTDSLLRGSSLRGPLPDLVRSSTRDTSIGISAPDLIPPRPPTPNPANGADQR